MASVETIDGIGSASDLVVRSPGFEPRLHRGLSPGHYELWNRIGPNTSIAELLERTSLRREDAVAFLRQLLLLQAIEVAKPAPRRKRADTPIEIVDPTELGQLSDRERELLDEDVELESYEKRRILAAARQIRNGDYTALLGVSKNSSRRELKRAYYLLSKDFHPDRFYGKKLGSFGPLLSRIFEAAADTVHALTARNNGPSGPRRRVSERYAFPLKMRVRCSAWAQPRDLVAQDICDRGLFIITSEPAHRGDRVEVTLQVRNHDPLTLRGRVVSSRNPEAAAHTGRRAGIGVELEPMDATAASLFRRIVEAARISAPVCAEKQAPTPLPKERIARGSGAYDCPTPIIGIDFGTTYTAVSAAIGSHVRLLPWEDGARAIPSVVAFPSRAQPVVGFEARKRLLTDPKHTIPSVKRLIGRAYQDRHVDRHLGQAAYQSQRAPDGSVLIEMWDESYAIPQLAALLFNAAAATAQRHLGTPVEHAVLTVPVGFDEVRIEAIRKAARLAQLEVVDIMDEPTAAALANRHDTNFGGIVGIYDFGGGTFDFSVVDASAGDMEVLGTSGDSWLGGDDLDLAIAEAAANQVWRVHRVDLRERVVEWQALLFACEHAKRQLSLQAETELVVPDALRTQRGGQDLRVRLSRPTCERLWSSLIARTLATMVRGLKRAGVKQQRLDAVYLSGGSTNVPAVQAAIARHFGVPVHVGVPSEYAACLGAGLHAGELARRMMSRERRIAS